jgi:hypothetical protein
MQNQIFNSAHLAQFTGSLNRYRHWLGLYYTDGVKYLADHANAYWLLDAIASHQPQALRDLMLREIQFWSLSVHEGGSATLRCCRDTDDVAIEQAIEWTDFPLPQIMLYVEQGTILLPSEH